MIYFQRGAIVICALVAAAAISFAQITVTQADLGRVFTPGNQILNRNDTLLTQVNVGTPGGPNFWDFRNFATHTFQVYNIVSVASTPAFRSNFPTATHAVKLDSIITQPINAGLVSIYQYLQLNSSGLRNLGNMAQKTIFFTPGELRTIVTPAELVYGVPLSNNTTWTTAFSNETRISLGGSIVSTTTTSHNATYTVDAYGTMRLPGSTQSTYALRVRKLNMYTNTAGNTFPILSYVFISKGGSLVQLNVTDTSARSGSVPVERGSLVWNYSVVSDSVTDVRIGETIPQAFALRQNYPNPFNPSTVVSFDLPKTEHVTLKVFNMLGQEVATLVDDIRPAGTYNAEWNAQNVPSGIYFARMQSGNFNAVRRMVLLK